MNKFRVAVLGATGMVGQRFVTLLDGHPWFELNCVAASARSAGRTYKEAVEGRWVFKDKPVPETIGGFTVMDAGDIDAITELADFVFCAVDMDKTQTRELEDGYARRETPVISNNSAHRLTPDVPMMIPEINDHHATVIEAQRERLGVKRGFVAVKPNCSIQSYVPALHPLREFGLQALSVCTYQAISGGSKTFDTWPEMTDNVIPYIGGGEEEKSESEPLKLWGEAENGAITPAKKPLISAQCYRVAASDGHMAAVSAAFDRKPSRDEILARWAAFEGTPQKLALPSAPKRFLTYFEEQDRPQTRLDRDIENGMGIALGRLRGDSIFDYRFTSLSHNTIRGAAGGGVLTAELLAHLGYIEHK